MDKRQYQTEAIAFLANSKRGIVESPAGSGKTIICAAALAQCLERPRPAKAVIEVMVNCVEHIAQFEKAFSVFPIIARNAKVSVFCAAGAPLDTSPDLLCVDECHHAASKSWAKKIKQAQKAIWGFSATPFGLNYDRNEKIRELFGPASIVIEREQLVEDGHLAEALVIWHTITDKGVTRNIEELKQAKLQEAHRDKPWMFEGNRRTAEKHTRQIEYRAVLQAGFYENEPRNAIIINEANAHIKAGHSVILLIGKISHGEALAAQIAGAVQCNSRLGKKKRRDTIEAFQQGEIRCLVATSLLEEGFDAPIASCLIVAAGGKSNRKSVQSTGRVLRPFDNKSHGIVIDFKDDFHPMISWHSEERFNTYAELNYEQHSE